MESKVITKWTLWNGLLEHPQIWSETIFKEPNHMDQWSLKLISMFELFTKAWVRVFAELDIVLKFFDS